MIAGGEAARNRKVWGCQFEAIGSRARPGIQVDDDAEDSMTFHLKGFLVFAAFASVLALAVEPRLGIVAIAAWLVIEALLWGGVAGFGRGGKSNNR